MGRIKRALRRDDTLAELAYILGATVQDNGDVTTYSHSVSAANHMRLRNDLNEAHALAKTQELRINALARLLGVTFGEEREHTLPRRYVAQFTTAPTNGKAQARRRRR